MRGLPTLLIEAFSEVPLSGNGAAVVLLSQPAPSRWMQQLAGRLRQSETAFLLPWEEAWALRWFTPTREVPLCGHATLAAILALGHWGRLPADGNTSFSTRSGRLRVRRCSEAYGPPGLGPALAQIELPRLQLQPMEPPGDLRSLLLETLKQVPEQFWGSDLGYQVGLLSASAPLASCPGLAEGLKGPSRDGLVLMQSLPRGREAAATVAGEAADYQLRFFAPGLGIDEDPVTGSAHALVAPLWMEVLQRPRVVGWQCSDRPGGMVCEAASSGMIRLTGSGHLLWDGTLWAEPGHGWADSEAQQDWQRACAR